MKERYKDFISLISLTKKSLNNDAIVCEPIDNSIRSNHNKTMATYLIKYRSHISINSNVIQSNKITLKLLNKMLKIFIKSILTLQM